MACDVLHVKLTLDPVADDM